MRWGDRRDDGGVEDLRPEARGNNEAHSRRRAQHSPVTALVGYGYCTVRPSGKARSFLSPSALLLHRHLRIPSAQGSPFTIFGMCLRQADFILCQTIAATCASAEPKSRLLVCRHPYSFFLKDPGNNPKLLTSLGSARYLGIFFRVGAMLSHSATIDVPEPSPGSPW